MKNVARGNFDVQATRQPPYDSAEGLSFARTSFTKQFNGDLSGTSTVEMLSAGTPIQGSAVYVALEHVVGTLGGRRGHFALAHLGQMNRGQASLELVVAPDSGTGELTGLSGKMHIEITGGRHFYRFEYSLPG